MKILKFYVGARTLACGEPEAVISLSLKHMPWVLASLFCTLDRQFLKNHVFVVAVVLIVYNAI